MQASDLTCAFVVTADQIDSRGRDDGVPAALAALADALDPAPVLGFERTTGDEIQALLADPRTVVDAIIVLTRLGGWRVGVGLGAVEEPLPDSTRAARGPAYVAAREAVDAARRAPADLALVRAGTVGGDLYGEDVVADAETALILLRWVLQRRTPEGWELIDLLSRDPVSRHAAAALGISPSAVSQRLARSAYHEARRGAALATRLLARACGGQG